MWVLDQGEMPALIDSNYLLYTDFETLVDQSSFKHTLNLVGTAALTTAQAKSGVQALATGTAGYMGPSVITNLQTIGTGDYTVEFDLYLPQVVVGYTPIFALTKNNSAEGVLIRIGNADFGNVLQFGPNVNDFDNVYNTAITRTQLANKWTKIVVQRKAGKSAIFVDSVKQTVRSRNGGGAAITDVTDAINFATVVNFRLGQTAGATDSSPVIIDNFKFSKIARY